MNIYGVIQLFGQNDNFSWDLESVSFALRSIYMKISQWVRKLTLTHRVLSTYSLYKQNVSDKPAAQHRDAGLFGQWDYGIHTVLK